jgi:8-oxo-dGTP pyrophosphatase MutT (NUDIX family)
MAERFKLIPAVYLLLRKDNKILLLQRANTGYQDGTYSLVAGHLDGDELAKQGMVREAQEEAGITINPKDLALVHTAHRLSRGQAGQERLDLFFECWQWQGEPSNMEPSKCSDLRWFLIHDLPSNTLPLIRLVIDNVLAGKPYSEYETEPLPLS